MKPGRLSVHDGSEVKALLNCVNRSVGREKQIEYLARIRLSLEVYQPASKKTTTGTWKRCHKYLSSFMHFNRASIAQSAKTPVLSSIDSYT